MISYEILITTCSVILFQLGPSQICGPLPPPVGFSSSGWNLPSFVHGSIAVASTLSNILNKIVGEAKVSKTAPWNIWVKYNYGHLFYGLATPYHACYLETSLLLT